LPLSARLWSAWLLAHVFPLGGGVAVFSEQWIAAKARAIAKLAVNR
jgi:hypothetical protein